MAKTPEELTLTLKAIIRAMTGRKTNKREISILPRKISPIIFMFTKTLIDIDSKQIILKEELEG